MLVCSFNSNANVSAQILYEGEKTIRVHGCWLNQSSPYISCLSGRFYELILAATYDGDNSILDDQRTKGDPGSKVVTRMLPRGPAIVTVIISIEDDEGPKFQFQMIVGDEVQAVLSGGENRFIE
jgi:hypothetical protein